MPTDSKILARAKELLATKPGPLMSPDLCGALKDCQMLAAALLETDAELATLKEALWPGLPKFQPTPEKPQQDFHLALIESFRTQHEMDQAALLEAEKESPAASSDQLGVFVMRIGVRDTKRLFTITELLAYRALRHEMAELFAGLLAKVDAKIAELSAGDQGVAR